MMNTILYDSSVYVYMEIWERDRERDRDGNGWIGDIQCHVPHCLVQAGHTT
jgi:hypothetical protein